MNTTPTQKKKILISGSGVAGILCALSLDPERYDIQMIERADSFRNLGFSVVLWKVVLSLSKTSLPSMASPS